MTCDQATMLLERRWDGALNGDEERALDEHIAACATCAAEAMEIAAADAYFAHLPDAAPPVNIAAAVAQQIAQEAPAEPNRRWIWFGLAAVAGMIALLWQLGLTPGALLGIPLVAAVVLPITHAVAEWLKPVVLFVQALSPALGPALRIAALPLLLELGLLALWMIRRASGRKVAGQA